MTLSATKYIRCPHIDDIQQELIKNLDSYVWMNWIADNFKLHPSKKIFCTCVCPECAGRSKDKVRRVVREGKGSLPSNHTAAVMEQEQGEGFAFVCRACGIRYSSVYEFLKSQGGSMSAEMYAIARWNADCAGEGWNCPTPRFWKDHCAKSYQNRAAAHKERYERIKRENKARYELKQQSVQDDFGFS